MRIIFLSVFFFITSFSFSQELSIGGFASTNWKMENNSHVLALGANVEYKPAKSVASFNSDLILSYAYNNSIITIPLYIKINIGNIFKVCPIFGAFVRSNKNYGYMAGLSIDYRIKKRLSIFLKADYMRDYWEDDHRYINYYSTDYGGKRINSTGGYSVWFNIGFKVNILKTSSWY